MSHAIKPRSAKEEVTNQRIIAETKAAILAAREKETQDIEKHIFDSEMSYDDSVIFQQAIEWYKRYKNL